MRWVRPQASPPYDTKQLFKPLGKSWPVPEKSMFCSIAQCNFMMLGAALAQSMEETDIRYCATNFNPQCGS